MADIKYVISVDEKGAIKSVQDFDKALDGLAKTTDKQAKPAVGKFEAAYAKLTATIAIGMAVYHAASKAIHALTGFVGDSVKAAIEAEEADNNLRLALETTGREVQGSLIHFRNYAESLMGVTRYDDEAIKSTQALLLQLTDLDHKGIDEATRGAIGLASVFKIDLDTAARIVTKATEGNVEMLGRYIPKLREAKTEAEKTAIMHDELAKMFNRAKGETETYSGRVNDLKKNYGELKETLGTVITQNQAVNDTLFVLTHTIKSLNEAMKDQNKTAEKHINLWHFFGPVAVYKALTGVMGHYAKQIRDAEQAEKDYAITFEKALGASWKFLQEHASAVTGGLEKFWKQIQISGKESGTAAPKVEKLQRSYRDLFATVKAGLNLREYLGGLKDMPEYFNATLPPGRNMVDVLKKVNSEMRLISTYSKKSFGEMAAGWQATMEKIKAAWDILHTALTGVFDQAQRNREIKLDNEYKKRLAIINSTITDEGERQKAIEALEAEYQIKRTSVQRTVAKQAKAVALMDAIVNVAAGVTKALSAAPPPFNIVLAAITAALGAVQIALIRAQPIPLAKGAIFEKRTRLYSESGATYDVGEGGEPEVLAPLSKLPAMARAVGRGGGMDTSPIFLTVPIYIGSEKIEERVIKIVNRSIGLKRIKAYAI